MGNKEIKNNIGELISALSQCNTTKIKAVIGLDGFIDVILHPVLERSDANTYTRIETLKEFGKIISKASGLSTSVEMVPIKSKLGGNGPILSNALGNYGMDITYIGALGSPDINPIFNEMKDKCTLISIGNPGLTDAVEFFDGKLMIGKRESLKELTWHNIKKTIGIDALVKMFNEANLIGLENWTMIPYMTEIWEGLLNEVIPRLPKSLEKKFIFFDLADPENRKKEDILKALKVINFFSSHFNVILGLNLKEAKEIAVILNVIGSNTLISLDKLTEKIYDKLSIYSVVIHPVKEASTICNGLYYHTPGPYEPNPKLTTGAGDNFNAGFCLGLALGLSPNLSLVLGTATSGYYVRNGQSPTLEEEIEFLKTWQESL